MCVSYPPLETLLISLFSIPRLRSSLNMMMPHIHYIECRAFITADIKRNFVRKGTMFEDLFQSPLSTCSKQQQINCLHAISHTCHGLKLKTCNFVGMISSFKVIINGKTSIDGKVTNLSFWNIFRAGVWDFRGQWHIMGTKGF